MKHSLLLLVLLLLFPFSAISQWKEMNKGLYGGQITFLQSSGNKLFAGTSGGVYMSDNNGFSWTLIYESYFEWHVNTMLAHKNDLYIAINNGKTFKSSDEGATWKEILFPPPPPGIFGPTTVFHLKSFGDKVFAVGSGVLFTIDPVTLATKKVEGVADVAGVAVTTTKIFAATRNGLFVSTDAGTTWANVPQAQFTTNFLSQVSSFGNAIMTVAGLTVALSLDNGATWKTVALPLPGGVGIYVEGGIILIGSSVRSLVSIDKGITWQPAGLPGVSWVARTPTGIFVGNYGGMYRSSNGMTWSECNFGIKSANSYAITSLDDHYFTSNGSRVFVNSDGTWRNCNLPTLPEEGINAIEAMGGNVLAGTFGSGLYITRDKGKTWSKQETLTGATNFARDGDDLYTANQQGIFISHDNGSSWTLFKANILGVFGMAFLNNYLYVSTIPAGELAVRRFDRQGNMTMLNGGIPANVQTSSFAAMGDVIYCTTNNSSVYTLDNTTLLWARKGPARSAGYMNIMVDGTKMYSYNFIDGVLASTNQGESWQVYSEGLPKRAAQSPIGRPGLRVINGDLYLATARAGVWTTGPAGVQPDASRYAEALPDFSARLGGDTPPFPDDFAGVVTAVEPVKEAARLTLFPNPVTNQVNVTLSHEPGMRAEIEVMDLGGKILGSEVISGTLHLNVESYQPGIYVVRAKTGGAVYVEKFLKK